MANLTLDFAWQHRLKIYTESNRLKAKGSESWIQGYKSWTQDMSNSAEGNKLWAEGNKLRAESDILKYEADELWIEAILAVHGNIKLNWLNWNDEYLSFECHLETGEVFGFPKK